MKRLRFALFAIANLAAGVLVVAVVSMGRGSTPHQDDLKQLRAALGKLFRLDDLQVTFHSGPGSGEVSLRISFTAEESVYVDKRRLEDLVDRIHRRAVIDYPGHPAGVHVEVAPPSDLLLVAHASSHSSYRSLQETLDAIGGAELRAYGRLRWGVDELSPRWEMVVIHHSATRAGSARSFDRYHREERHWAGGLGYHFVIGNGNGAPDGLVEVGRRWRDQADGAHAGVTRVNHVGVGICLVGDFNRTRPTDRQMASLRTLLRWLHLVCEIDYDEVKGHRDVKPTKCPGKKFPMDGLLDQLHRDELRRLGLVEE